VNGGGNLHRRHILKHGEWAEFEQGETIQEFKLYEPCEYFHIMFAVCTDKKKDCLEGSTP
jgi:hypothetical protein